MLEERSAGAIIYRQSPGGKLYLLLNYPSGHWDFVKGNIEKGENFKQTVLREIREETGIEDITFVDGFEDKVEYHYQRDGQVIHKEVVFFVANTKTNKVVLSHEHRDYTWLNFNDALEKLTYKTAQNLFKKIKDL
ncbi:MAG: NUDIX domain-containing protein [Thaumarchaeota archaeon]|nr:NUDIX domain-containing protein [Nitrososphaerota archaeon]MDE1838438.1 NUDIX domain-containing protein [Nitrososphaerota archaeon]